MMSNITDEEMEAKLQAQHCMYGKSQLDSNTGYLALEPTLSHYSILLLMSVSCPEGREQLLVSFFAKLNSD